ncbi:response regulator receiver [Geoanaerobacter pelophilus]|uniref:histidine kinase n=1 Tax=Geoanaerobacter pelophilus TaxID=60036 RepID=A0ABQ0MH70_9BACT|nr:response regulator [Geoanaerobacter pelophilus]GAW66441.1 response regulator receiver [Geoanaerobacter pelophilus]
MDTEKHHIIVDEILELASISAGKARTELAPFSPQQVIENLLLRHHLQAERKGLELRAQLAPELPNLLIGDAKRLSRILDNLLKNALALTRHGYIGFSAAVHQRYRGGVSLAFAVQDCGSGEPAEGEAQLALDLGALDAEAINSSPGLGLALCKALVTLLGGEIWCDGVPGLGNTFTFRLPFGDAAAAGSEAAKGAARRHPGFNGERVLLAEDNPFNQQVACALLERSGLSVTLAQNGAEAVELVARCDFDLVLMDVQMPVMDGLAAAREIRQLSKPGMAELPILAVSANAMEHDVRASLVAGMNDHLCKPFTPDSLYGCIAQWLGKGAPGTVARSAVAGAGTAAFAQVVIPVDFEAGVRLTGGNAELYRDLLARFRQEYGARGEEVRRELALGNRQEATRLAHSVKGVAGVLAAFPLHGAALRLESALKGDDDAELLLEDFQAELSRALAYLREHGDAPRE